MIRHPKYKHLSQLWTTIPAGSNVVYNEHFGVLKILPSPYASNTPIRIILACRWAKRESESTTFEKVSLSICQTVG